MEREERIRFGERLAEIAKQIKRLEKKRGEVRNHYFSYVRNPLIGFEGLWGTRALRNLPKRDHYDHYRELFFKDIKLRSRLNKINGKISLLADEYQRLINQIKEL